MRIHNAEFVLSAVRAKDFIRDGRGEIAFVGRSNVGKSSLLNRLLNRRKLARTSSTPGRTRAINYFLINDDFYFVDLPGYGWARAGRDERRQWARLVDEYFEQALPAARVVLLIDGKVGATPLDVQALEFLAVHGAVFAPVATKVDKVKKSRRHRALADIRTTLTLPDMVEVLPVSARTGEGLDALWRWILN